MTEKTIICPQCRVPFTRRWGGEPTGKGRGFYYPIEQYDVCAECRLGVRWFPEPPQEEA